MHQDTEMALEDFTNAQAQLSIIRLSEVCRTPDALDEAQNETSSAAGKSENLTPASLEAELKHYQVRVPTRPANIPKLTKYPGTLHQTSLLVC